ncbi:MAG: helix-turn-helix domain-containing protein, partial [bacterium]
LDRYDLLPNPAYAKGFVRIYARELGLDPFPILKKLSGEIPEAEEDMDLDPESLEAIPARSEERGKGVQAFGFMVVVLIAFLGLVIGGVQLYRVWPRVSHTDESKPLFEAQKNSTVSSTLKKAKEEKATPTVREGDEEEVRRAEVIAAPPQDEEENADQLPVRRAELVEGQILKAELVNEGSNPSPPVAGNQLRLIAHEACRAQVIGISGDQRQVLFDDVVPEGETFPVASEEAWAAMSFEVTLEKAEQVDVVYNNQNLGRYHSTGLQTFRVPDAWSTP